MDKFYNISCEILKKKLLFKQMFLFEIFIKEILKLLFNKK